jgi:hypothetical protein
MIRKLGMTVLLLVLGSVVALAADLNGKWTAQITTKKGAETTTFEFHADGVALTGKVTTPHGETDIIDGKVDGDSISFAEMVHTKKSGDEKAVYTGKADGDTIKFSRQIGDRPATEFVASRAQ